ncbi:MAG: acylphosphatase [Alphaproteobacteria bacterium]
MLLALRLRIKGRVQGVGYRDWAILEARALGLAGWVRNRADGSVEALVAGDAADVEVFIMRAGEGPRHARVSAVEREAAEALPEPGFRRLPTV